MSSSVPLTATTFAEALDRLVRDDPDLAAIRERYGTPPFRVRPPGFATLVQIILEQQVSLASARSTFDKLVQWLPALTPNHFLEMATPTLCRTGLSRQKQEYCRGLAKSIVTGAIDLDALSDSDDATIRARLCALKGVGAWTADVYLLLALRRPDVWPCHDLALIRAVQQVKRLKTEPGLERMQRLAEPWRPRRAVAARLLWHHYLSAL